jgi:hypothetical protein
LFALFCCTQIQLFSIERKESFIRFFRNMRWLRYCWKTNRNIWFLRVVFGRQLKLNWRRNKEFT